MGYRTILTPWGPRQAYPGSTNRNDYLMIDPDPTESMTAGQARAYYGRIDGTIVWDAYNRVKNGTMPKDKSLKDFWRQQNQEGRQAKASAQRASRIEGFPHDTGHGISAKDKAPGNLINQAPQTAKGEAGNRRQGSTTAVKGYNIDEMGIPRNMKTAWYYYLADIKDENNLTAKDRARILHLGEDAVAVTQKRQLELRGQQHPDTAPSSRARTERQIFKDNNAEAQSGPVKTTQEVTQRTVNVEGSDGSTRQVVVKKPNRALQIARTARNTAPVWGSIAFGAGTLGMSAQAAVENPSAHNIEDVGWDAANLLVDGLSLIPAFAFPLEGTQKVLNIGQQTRMMTRGGEHLSTLTKPQGKVDRFIQGYESGEKISPKDDQKLQQYREYRAGGGDTAVSEGMTRKQVIELGQGNLRVKDRGIQQRADKSGLSFLDQRVYEAGGGKKKQGDNRLSMQQVMEIGQKNLNVQDEQLRLNYLF